MTLRILGEPDAQTATLRTFEGVYRSEVSYVWATLRRLGVGEKDSEDLVQEVFIILHRRFDQVDASRPVRPYLFGMARRVAANYRRSAPVRREVGMDDVSAGALAPAAIAPPQHEWRDLLIRALQALDYDKRCIVIMHDLDGFSVAEIAQVFDMKVDTLYSHLRRGRRKLAESVRALEAGQPLPVEP